MTQPQAVSYCAARGGELSSIVSRDENDYLRGKTKCDDHRLRNHDKVGKSGMLMKCALYSRKNIVLI